MRRRHLLREAPGGVGPPADREVGKRWRHVWSARQHRLPLFAVLRLDARVKCARGSSTVSGVGASEHGPSPGSNGHLSSRLSISSPVQQVSVSKHGSPGGTGTQTAVTEPQSTVATRHSLLGSLEQTFEGNTQTSRSPSETGNLPSQHLQVSVSHGGYPVTFTSQTPGATQSVAFSHSNVSSLEQTLGQKRGSGILDVSMGH